MCMAVLDATVSLPWSSGLDRALCCLMSLLLSRQIALGVGQGGLAIPVVLCGVVSSRARLATYPQPVRQLQVKLPVLPVLYMRPQTHVTSRG